MQGGYDTVAGLKALVPVVKAVTAGVVSDEEQLLPFLRRHLVPFRVDQVACG